MRLCNVVRDGPDRHDMVGKVTDAGNAASLPGKHQRSFQQLWIVTGNFLQRDSGNPFDGVQLHVHQTGLGQFRAKLTGGMEMATREPPTRRRSAVLEEAH